MSYHILHINTPNCKLSVEQGILFCRTEGDVIKKIPLNDIKAIIVLEHGTIFTNYCLARLLENNVVILHCNNRYQPAGLSLPLERIVRPKVFNNQIIQNEVFTKTLWKKILITKVSNQAILLDLIGKKHNLYNLINRPLINEANIAKQYWKYYFSTLGKIQKREHTNAQSYENCCLNYGYAVIKTLIYRSIIVHGLIASLGVHHIGKYKSSPLVYDLMEPFRPFIDYYLYKYSIDCQTEFQNENFKQWCKYLANCLKNYRLEINEISYKLTDAIDIYIEKIVNAYITFKCQNTYMPILDTQYFAADGQRNREYEE